MSFQAENALENAPAAIAITSLAGYLLYANKPFAEWFDLQPGELTARNHIVQVTGQRIHAAFLDAVIRNDGLQQVRVTCASTQGASRELLCSARCIVENAVPTSLAWVLQDASTLTTERGRQLSDVMDMLAAQRLIGAFSWRLLLENTGQATNNPVQWSPEVYELIGDSARSIPMTTQTYLKLVVPEDRQGFVDAINDAVASAGGYVYHYKLKMPDGSLRTMRSCGSMVKTTNAATPVLIGMEIDVTQQVLRSRDEQGESQRLRALIDEIDGPVFLLDRKLCYVEFNTAYVAVVAMQSDKPVQIGASYLDSIKDPLRQRHYRSLFARVFNGERIAEEAVVDGSEAAFRRWLDYSYSPVRNADGHIEDLLALGRDVSLVRRAEQRRQRLSADVEHAVASRTEELTLMKREFNEAIYHATDKLQALLDTISAAGSSPAARQAANTHMQLLIADMQQLAQVGEHALSLESIDSQRLVQTALKEAALVEGYEIDIDQLPVVRCDSFLLGLVFSRLLDNAARYSYQRKPARIRIRCTQRARDSVWVVTDNGLGFREDESQQIFMPFFQPDSVPDKPGSGLELTIVKQAVQRMGGRVWAYGEPDRGATFYFVLGYQADLKS
jgi:signal transduction histidine kinase